MAKSTKGTTLCGAYCGQLVDKKTQEHFVPQGLWAGPRPNRTLTVAAHAECNNVFAKDDEYFRDALLCMRGVDKHPEAAGTIELGLFRSWERSPHHTLLHEFGLRSVVTGEGVVLEKMPTMTLDVVRFGRSLDRISRALFYIKSGFRPLPNTHTTIFYDSSQVRDDSLQQFIATMGPMASFGDSVFMYRHRANETDPHDTAWLFLFYERAAFLCRTVPRDG